eukprot:UC4_evm6s94
MAPHHLPKSLCAAVAAAAAISGATFNVNSAPHPPRIFDPSINDGKFLQARKMQEMELRSWIAKVSETWKKSDEAQKKLMAPRMRAQAEMILYPGTKPGDREKYLKNYGCTAPTSAAVEAVAKHSPIIEMGAGAGHWNVALKDLGADIVSFDDFSSIPCPIVSRAKIEATDGTTTELKKAKYKHRTLLLVYPSPGPFAKKCVDSFCGSTMIYVGEPRGGANADDDFFDEVEKQFSVIEQLDRDCLNPFAGGIERFINVWLNCVHNSWFSNNFFVLSAIKVDGESL